MDRLKTCYNLLLRVYRDGSYSGLELNTTLLDCEENDKAFITRLFYGVLDQSVRFDFYIGSLCEKKPQGAVVVLLKIGFYLLEFMNMQNYAAVNETVALAKSVGKGGASGFINAVLRRHQSIVLPKSGNERYLSVSYSAPMWYVKWLIEDYGYKFTEAFLSAPKENRTHIRHKKNQISSQEFIQKYPNLFADSYQLGYYVTHNTLKLLKNTDYTIQSLASMLAVKAYTDGLNGEKPFSVLDVCSAPGGKSVYLKELFPLSHVTACDLHAHRVELIQKYALSCHVELSAVQKDATVYDASLSEQFDLVICDVPCSGLGVTDSKPDILLNRKPEDIVSLNALQQKILETSALYVRKGGRLCYSTCTVLKAENDSIVDAFLAKHTQFESVQLHAEYGTMGQDGRLRLFPHTTQTDGFFVAVLQYKGDNCSR